LAFKESKMIERRLKKVGYIMLRLKYMKWMRLILDQKGSSTPELLVYTVGIAILGGVIYTTLAPIVGQIFSIGANSIKTVTSSGL